MTPKSILKSQPRNQSIPLKSVFGRVLKDITNTSPDVGLDSQLYQSRVIPSPSPRLGNILQSPYGASTSMASCKSKSILHYNQLLFLLIYTVY